MFFDEVLRLRVNLGEGYKSPTADQLAADYVHSSTGVHYLGNPDLDPETSLTYDCGFDVYLESMTLKVDYFHTDYEDKIVSDTSMDNGVRTTTYVNHGDAAITGVEVGLQWATGQTISLPFDASFYTTMSFITDMEDKETGKDLLYISDYEIKSGLNITYRGLSAQLSHVLVGPQMITNWDTYADEEKDSFDFWDLTLRCRFAENWEVRGSILNLFDQEVEWVRGHLMPERNYRIGLTYNF